MKSRIITFFVLISFLWILLLVRAFTLQVFPDQRLQALRDKQFQTMITLQARRGAITDRNGRDLALSERVSSLYADPSLIEAPRALSKKLAKKLGTSWEVLYSKLKDKNKRFVWLQRFMENSSANEIKEMKIRGLNMVDEWKRVYPNDTLLSQTLGIVGNEGTGLEGLELTYDSELKGNKQKISVRRDARGRPLMAEGLLFTENPDGNDLQLTIDSEIQYVLENELSSVVHEFEAKSAVGVILDADTSAIRAMASAPYFNLNQWSKAPTENKRNRAVTDMMEPGSTMKSFAVASALKNKILQPNSKYFCEWGLFKVADRWIKEADQKHKFGFLTVSEILAFSSNIGSTKIAFEVGDQLLRQTLSDFGFGQKLGVDLPGEAKGLLHESPWNQHLLSNISFGHGISATALQVANGYAALVNGGILRVPYVVESIRQAETQEINIKKPQVIHRVLSAEESEKMRLMLMAVTNEGGTGVNARVNGFLVGGKTGTAQKANPNGLGYLPNSYISSFAGFIPAHHPKFVIYIAVDEPRKAYYGSQVAAPVFSRVASYAARKEGLAPLIMGDNKLISDSLKMKKSGLAKETPAAPIKIDFSSEVPDFRTLSVREILRNLQGTPVEVKFVGAGKVSLTDPPAGSAWNESKKLTVYLE